MMIKTGKEGSKTEERKIFIPHELKTIEIDVEKKIFRVNGEDFGKSCTEFSIGCSAGRKHDEWFDITVRISTDVKYANYDIHGEKTKEGNYKVKE